MSIVMLVVVRIIRTAIHVPESVFNINSVTINILVMLLCYLLSRTRYYRKFKMEHAGTQLQKDTGNICGV